MAAGKREGWTKVKISTDSTTSKFYSGIRAIPFRIKFIISSIKYLLQRKKYRLFFLNPAKGGLLKTLWYLNKIKFRKNVRFKSFYYLSLTIPRWPSRAFDHMVSKGGLNIKAAGTPRKSQIDLAILGISRKCLYKCKHCYEQFNLNDQETVPLERWQQAIEELQAGGVNIIAFSGGEPMLRFSGLVELLESADKSLSEFHIYTSGYNVTPENARILKEAGLHGAAVGLDDVNPQRYDNFRGYQGAYEQAVQALTSFHQAGVFPYLNVCLSKELVRSRDLWRLLDLAKTLGAGALRLLEPKPCGGYISEKAENLFSHDDHKSVSEFYIKVNKHRKFRHHPLVVHEAYVEKPSNLGCMMGGHTHLHIDSTGHVAPCVFLPISFGNILDETFTDIYKRMREAIPRPLPKECPSLFLADTIRSLKDQGVTLPMPYKTLEKEWSQMFESV